MVVRRTRGLHGLLALRRKNSPLENGVTREPRQADRIAGVQSGQQSFVLPVEVELGYLDILCL